MISKNLYLFIFLLTSFHTIAQEVSFAEDIPTGVSKIITTTYLYHPNEKVNQLHKKTIAEYDAKKRLVSETEVDFTNTDIHVITNIDNTEGFSTAKRYEYSQMGDKNELSIKSFSNAFQSKQWLDIRKDTLINSEKLRYIESSVQTTISSDSYNETTMQFLKKQKPVYEQINTFNTEPGVNFIGFKETYYEYNETMQPLRIDTSEKKARNIEADSISTIKLYQYRDNGKPNAEAHYKFVYQWNDAIKQFKAKSSDSSYVSYTYLPKGYTKNYSNKADNILYKTEHFDEQDRLLKSESYDSDRNQLLVDAVYVYNSAGKLVEETLYDAGVLDIVFYHKYNSLGRLVKTEIKYGASGKILPYKEIAYE